MKKILSALVFAICFLSVNFCSAGLKDYYDNNSNYKILGGRQGYYSYIYLPSVHVQEYNPPHYQIGFNELYIDENAGTKKWIYNGAKRYNWYTKESFHLENGYWVKDNVTSPPGPAQRARYAADALFRVAYGMDFYGY